MFHPLNSAKYRLAPSNHSGSSVVKYMSDSLLQGDKFPDNVYAAGSMRGVFDAVKERRNAIGLVGVSWISSDLKTSELTAEERAKTLETNNDTTATTFTEDVKVLAIRRDSSTAAYKPYQAYIFDGSYPLDRPIYMINTGSVGVTRQRIFRLRHLIPGSEAYAEHRSAPRHGAQPHGVGRLNAITTV